MTTNTSKIKIRLGPVEVEYEGSEEFLKKELPELLSYIAKLYRESTVPDGRGPRSLGSQHQTPPPKGDYGTTGNISAQLKVKSGSDLAIAAAARLTLGHRKDSFTRDELLAEMRTATHYYKKSYSNNLTKTLAALMKNKFTEPATGKYALSASGRADLESRLAS